jgi:hypothetical protein
MTQISRPLQVAIAAVGLVAVVWFFALRGHSSSSEPTTSTPVASSSASSASAASSASSASSAGASSSTGGVYHGSAPGVEGLTRAIQKAHGAVATSEANAAQLQRKSAEASGEAGATGGTAAATTAAATHSAATSSAAKTSAAPAVATKTHAASHAAKTSTAARNPTIALRVTGLPAGQAWVERALELKPAPTVALFFYDRNGADDVRTLQELRKVLGAKKHIVLRVASASEVGTYGSFTRVSSIYQTPTLLLVSPSGKVSQPITGLVDVFAIEQALAEQRALAKNS